RLGDRRGLRAESVLEIGADRQVDRSGQRTDVSQDRLTAGSVIGDADRACVARARGGEGLEAETGEDAGRGGIPWVRRDEGARRGVEGGKVDGLLGLALHGWPDLPSSASVVRGAEIEARPCYQGGGASTACEPTTPAPAQRGEAERWCTFEAA